MFFNLTLLFELYYSHSTYTHAPNNNEVRLNYYALHSYFIHIMFYMNTTKIRIIVLDTLFIF